MLARLRGYLVVQLTGLGSRVVALLGSEKQLYVTKDGSLRRLRVAFTLDGMSQREKAAFTELATLSQRSCAML